MMFFLLLNVVDQNILAVNRVGKCTIPNLPTAKLLKDAFLFDELCAGQLDVLNQIGKG